MRHPLVSFVVPCYGMEKYVRECLESILGQEGDWAFEVVVIEDCSKDRTLEEILAVRDERIRLIVHEANQGFVKTISEGLVAARGRFVARIDPDDRYRSHFLNKTVPRLLADETVGCVYGGAAMIGPRGEPQGEDWDRIHFNGDAKGNEFVALLKRNYVCAPTVIAKRELWLESLPVPAHLAFTDWYHNLMMARRGDFYYVNEVLADYRVHPGNMHSRVFLDGSEEKTIRYLLDRIFAETEAVVELERAKQAARHEIYAAQFVTLADKYFGAGINGDARRCYLEAMRHRPSLMLDAGVLRRTLATMVSRNAYEGLKRIVRPRLGSA